MKFPLLGLRPSLLCTVFVVFAVAGYSPWLAASSFSVAGIEVQGPQAMATSAGQPNGAIFIQA
ncbi:MAG: hypothetical protein ACO3VE_07340, partial [Burkholderiaceae bacterium]